jgi:hypothetical protein
VDWLKEFSVKCRVDIHAWVLMTYYVDLLCTPQEGGGVRVEIIKTPIVINRKTIFLLLVIMGVLLICC